MWRLQDWPISGCKAQRAFSEPGGVAPLLASWIAAMRKLQAVIEMEPPRLHLYELSAMSRQGSICAALYT